MDKLFAENETYLHDASFQGIFVTQPARLTKFIIPGVQAVYIPLGEEVGFAYAPNNFHDMFYHWQFQEGERWAMFVSPLLSISGFFVSAN